MLMSSLPVLVVAVLVVVVVQAVHKHAYFTSGQLARIKSQKIESQIKIK